MSDKEVLLTIEDIKKYLPHRYPFLFVDKVMEIKDNRITTIKSVTGNENYFMGHFPGYPVMPGVLQVEALAQTAALLVIYKYKLQSKPIYFLSIDKVKFRNQVVPGDTLRLEVVLERWGGRVARCKGKAFVEDKMALEAELVAMISK